MAPAHVLEDRSTPAVRPPMDETNEATSEQLKVARTQGDAYGRALEAMAAEEDAVVARAGHYTVAVVTEKAEGLYGFQQDQLRWMEPPEAANAHIEVAVADGGDGRFVPQLDITITLLDGDRELFTAAVPYVWHPFLHHYGVNAEVPGEGPYTVKVHIEPPTFHRHDPKNGLRYAEPVDVVFSGVTFEPGRKSSPAAEPSGETTPYAHA